ncbi:MAG: hypothetical protein MN733_31965, partial [Nitrososphaera sp.]|nr:hypothetical protein [Nitrososphaera sp.]
ENTIYTPAGGHVADERDRRSIKTPESMRAGITNYPMIHRITPMGSPKIRISCQNIARNVTTVNIRSGE